MASFGGDYWRLWAASTGSNLGDGIVLAALPLLAAELTRDPVGVAGVTVAAQLPWLVFGLLAGVVVDRVDRRTVMWTVDVGRAALLAGLAVAVWLDVVSLPVVYVVVFALGIGETLFDTAAQSVLPRLVRPDQLEDANGRLFGAQLTANGFVGPPLGGLLFAVAVSLPFGVDAITFVVSAGLILRIRTQLRPAPTQRTSVAADVREGLRWLVQEPIVRAFAVGAGVINLGYAAASAVLVLYAQDHLGLDDVGFGFLLAAAAVGGVAGTLLSGWVVRRVGRRAAVLAAVWLMAATLVGMGAIPNAFVVGVLFSAHAVGVEVWNVVAVSYRQAVVPDELLGRVMSGYRVIAFGAFPLGAAAGGVIARATSVRVPLVVGGLWIAGLLPYLIPALTGDRLQRATA